MAEQEMTSKSGPVLIMCGPSLHSHTTIAELLATLDAKDLGNRCVIIDDLHTFNVDFTEIEHRIAGIEEFREQYLCDFTLDLPAPVQAADEPEPKKTRPFAPIPPWDRRFRKR